MEKNTAALIKGLSEEIEAAVNEKELWLKLYRDEKARADKAEAELKRLCEPVCGTANKQEDNF